MNVIYKLYKYIKSLFWKHEGRKLTASWTMEAEKWWLPLQYKKTYAFKRNKAIIQPWQSRYRRNKRQWHLAMNNVVRRLANEIRDEIDKEILAEIQQMVDDGRFK
jgi:chromatin remodeling complex protein RSC6